jgi:aspartate-semialdehyde dehydrogenase
MSSGFRFAIVGATGAVGRQMLAVLEERKLPVASLKLLASERSAGEVVEFQGNSHMVELLTPESFKDIDIALFSAGGGVSLEYGPIAAEHGAIVIDNSSAFRMTERIPLIVPEVNANVLRQALQKRDRKGFVVANPNCSTIQLVVVLKPIDDKVKLSRVVVSTYQSVAGAGQKGIEELSSQVLGLFQQREPEPKHFPHQIAFNCIPQIDVFEENGYTKEEMKVVRESRKIMGLPDLRITATAVRVPVFSCHSESVNIETVNPLSAVEAQQLLKESPGIIVMDDPSIKEYPLAAKLAETDAVYVGRIRNDESVPNGLNMWIVADNLRKGAALNAVQIAEIVMEQGLAH